MIGLPSLAALDGAAGPRIWLAVEATDMLCGFDRLAARVQAVTGESPLSGHLSIFLYRVLPQLWCLKQMLANVIVRHENKGDESEFLAGRRWAHLAHDRLL